MPRSGSRGHGTRSRRPTPRPTSVKPVTDDRALLWTLFSIMAIALLLWRPFRGEKWVRVAILLPLVATPVAVGMMWRLIFDPNIGFANQMLDHGQLWSLFENEKWQALEKRFQ